MKTWVDFEPEVNQLADVFENLFQLWWLGGGVGKPVLREDLDRELRSEGSFLKKSKDTCPHGATPLTCNKCYFNNQ